MSLTSFLKDNAELRILIDQIFEKPDVTIEAERVADPQTTNYALIGTAFDYVFRFKLEREYDDVDSKPWVAHQGLQLAELTDRATDRATGRDLSGILADAERLHRAYLDSGEMMDELLAATLDLGRLDWIYRSGRVSDEFGEAKEGDIADLWTLYESIPEHEFSGADTVLLNPTFGSASGLVNGADADLVLDSTLIDLKTVKDPTLKPGYWRQLIGYCVLADLAYDELDHMPKFTDVGIYFSRHGILWRTSASQIYDHEKYTMFKDWFRDEAEDHFAGTLGE